MSVYVITVVVLVLKLNVAIIVTGVVEVDACVGCTGEALVYSCDVYHLGVKVYGYG